MLLVDQIAEWAASAQVFPEARKAARRVLMDQIGVSRAGAANPAFPAGVGDLLSAGSAPCATIWHDGRAAFMPTAVLVNRCVGDALELTSGPECGAAAVAAAEVASASLGDLLDAVAVAAEVDEYFRSWLMEPIEHHGLHPPALLAGITASVAAGRLFAMTASRLAGTVAAVATLLPQSPYVAFSAGAAAKLLYGGWGQMLGVWSVLLERAGVEGPRSAFEGSRGLAQAMLDAGGAVAAPRFEPDGLAITRVSFKVYPCNRGCQAPLAALARIGPIDPADLASLTVWTYPYAVELDRRSSGSSPISAQMSIRTTLALAILYGLSNSRAWYTPERVSCDRVRTLARRIEVKVDPDTNTGVRARRARLELIFMDGSRREASSAASWGPEEPATDQALRERFLALTKGAPGLDPWEAPESLPVCNLLETARA